jgi:hypothetical protein
MDQVCKNNHHRLIFLSIFASTQYKANKKMKAIPSGPIMRNVKAKRMIFIGPTNGVTPSMLMLLITIIIIAKIKIRLVIHLQISSIPERPRLAPQDLQVMPGVDWVLSLPNWRT